jgi:protein TonB
MIFRHQSLSHRLPWIGLSLTLPAGMFWLFAHGLTASVIRTFVPPDITIERFKPEPPKKPPPPEPKLIERVETTTIKPPPFEIARDQDTKTITVVTAPAGNGAQQPVAPDRGPVGIAATRTTPPYPVIARRVGWEGTVMLRLTVSPQGRVSRADVVTSSGHIELDRTAQDWVVAHWTYKPAIKDGAPVEAQVLTRLLFSLDASR